MNAGLLQAIREAIAESTGRMPDEGSRCHSVGGGCINSAYRLDGAPAYFLKINSEARLAMFEAEAEGLRDLAAAKTIKIPGVVAAGVAEGHSFLVLEALDLSGRGSPEAERRMGEQLAALHRVTSPDGHFGWRRDNTIGETLQCNNWGSDWVTFYGAHRLRFQVDLAREKGLRLADGERLIEGLSGFFKNYLPLPSLLHGDLWGGNAGFTRDGTPVIYDPAVYYGDRETDLAFTEMFGGFGPSFYVGYEAAWPLDPGYHSGRKTLYNLYHVLNHFNLFGGGYGRQAEGMIRELLHGAG